MSTTTTTTTAEVQLGAGLEARKVKEPQGVASFKEVPVIDLCDIDSNDPTKLAALASQIYDACTKVGFFYIKNHGVPKDAIKQVKDEAAHFFKEYPLEKKLALNRDTNEYHCGYGPFEEKPRGKAIRAHRFESILFGREVAFDKEYQGKVDPKYDFKNQFPEPDVLPEFRPTVSKYFGEMLALSRRLARIFALSLNLDKHFFDSMLDRPFCLLSMNYYADKVKDSSVNSSIMAHTDHEMFTILLQTEDVNALEVVNGDGVWVPAKPIEDTFVVNIGDVMAIWTNNIFLSTLHRATNTSGQERFSIPFFFGPNADAVLETLPSCITETRPLKYKPTTQGAHFLSKMNTSYGYGSEKVNA